jgi:anti-sigma factor RsiW
MQCPESIRAQAYFDRELDSPGAADIERHAQHCGKCCKLLENLKQMRCALRRELTFMSIPAAKKVRIVRALNQECRFGMTPAYRRALRAWRARPFWQGAFAGIGAVVLAVSLTFLRLRKNGINRFHPQSSLLNRHFPGDKYVG